MQILELSLPCACRPRKPAQHRQRLISQKSPESTPEEEESHASTPISHQDLAMIVAAAVPEPSTRIASFFVGDGGYGAILDAIDPSSQRHFQIFAAAEKALSIEDLEYLKVKGCFTLPECRAELLEAYFRYVHPTFPVIDARSFLSQYAAKGFEGINLLLLWSIFSVSASYLPNIEGGRIACKETYTARAKLLFDISHENDKTVLVQSALLISFWYADTDDVKQSWYWTGVAFSIAQALGLHSKFDATSSETMLKKEDTTWYNIWLCCFVRDVWQAFWKGRPVRLLTTVGVPSTQHDGAQLLTDLVLHGKLLYTPNEAKEIGRMWRTLVAVSNALREIITTKSPPSSTETERLKTCFKHLPESIPTPTPQHVVRHLQLYHCAARICLSRVTHEKIEARSAADDMTSIVLSFLQQDTVTYAAPVTIPLLVPAIATYLAIWKTDREKMNEQLDVYGRFLAAVGDNHPAGMMLKMVVEAAQKVIVEKQGEVVRQEDCSMALGGSELYDFEQGGFFDVSWMDDSSLCI